MNKIAIIVGIILLFAASMLYYTEGYDTVEWTLTTTIETLGPRYEVLSSITDEASGTYDYEWFTWKWWEIDRPGTIPITGPSYADCDDNGNSFVYGQGFTTRPRYDGDYITSVKQVWKFTRVR